MKKLKRIVALTALVGMLGSSNKVHSAEYVSTTSGYGYEQCRLAPYVTPLIVLSVIAVAVIVVVALQNSHGGHNNH
jgi:hypothetical protein